MTSAFDYDELSHVDLDNMVSEVKQQSYNQEILKSNFQIILKELRNQRNLFHSLQSLEKENKNLKANLADMNNALKKLINQVKTQADQLEQQQQNEKNRVDELEKLLNQSQDQVQTISQQQKEDEKKQQITYLEMNFIKEKQEEIQKDTKVEVDTTKDDLAVLKQQLSQMGLRVDMNSQSISTIKSQVTEVKSSQSSLKIAVSKSEKKMGDIEVQNTKLTEQIGEQAKDIHSHSISIKDLYEQQNKTNESVQNQSKQISQQQQNFSNLETSIHLKNAENDKDFSNIKEEIELLKKQIETFAKQLKIQSKQFGSFVTKDHFEKSIKELKDQQHQWSIQFEITMNKEIEELKKYLANHNKFITQDDLHKFFNDLVSKAADKGQTKKALLYLENLILSLLNMKVERANIPAAPFTTQQLLWSAPKCAACLNSGQPGKDPIGSCHHYQQYPRHPQNNNFLCCTKALQVNLDKSIISNISMNQSPKFNLRPQSAKSSNYPGPKVQAQQQSQSKLPNQSLIIKVDLDILPNNEVDDAAFEDKKLKKGNQLFQAPNNNRKLKNTAATTENYKLGGN